MRIALVGGSELMAWIVGEVSPVDVEVEHLPGFVVAKGAVETRPPDAVIFAISPERPPWDELVGLCDEHQPPIPSTVYFSRDHRALDADGSDIATRGDLGATPGRDELHDRICALRDAARRSCGGTPRDR